MRRTHRLLFAEDDAVIAEMYRLKLEQEGWEVELATDGREVLRAATNRPPDLILLDLRLAGMDGRTVLKGLLADQLTRRIPVVVFSNSSRDDDEAREALRLGARAYLVKADTEPRKLAQLLAPYV
jgi:two-component system KDP operon response regulator KdpE